MSKSGPILDRRLPPPLNRLLWISNYLALRSTNAWPSKKHAFRSLDVKGSIYTQAPSPEVKWLDDMAAGRLLPARPDGKTYKCLTVAPIGLRLRTEQLYAALAEAGCSDYDLNGDVTQSPNFTCASSVAPTIIRNSRIFNMG